MILKTIMSILIEVIAFIWGTIGDTIPDIDFLRYIKDFIEIISEVMQQAVNFLYLCIGEAIYPIARMGNIFTIIQIYNISNRCNN